MTMKDSISRLSRAALPLAEDDPATSLAVLANDTDSDGGPKQIDSATQPANGTVTIAADKQSLSYTPDADYCNSQAGGSPDSDRARGSAGRLRCQALAVAPPTDAGVGTARPDRDS